MEERSMLRLGDAVESNGEQIGGSTQWGVTGPGPMQKPIESRGFCGASLDVCHDAILEMYNNFEQRCLARAAQSGPRSCVNSNRGLTNKGS
jgi:hypothetical protein